MIKEFFKNILYEPLFNLLVFFAWLVPGHSIGWAIIMLTFLVRLLLWAPSVKALKAPLMMRQYKDEIAVIQERYKDNRVAQAQALMAFYKEKGINPLSGCLPLLIQLPVLIILYRVFLVGVHDVRPDLLYSFTPHLDAVNPMFFGIDLTVPERFILPLLAAGLQYLQTKHFQQLNPPPTVDSKDPAAILSRQMVVLFPLMTFFVAMSFPAGLALYWAATTLFSWLQQLYIAKTFVPTRSTVSVTVRQKTDKNR